MQNLDLLGTYNEGFFLLRRSHRLGSKELYLKHFSAVTASYEGYLRCRNEKVSHEFSFLVNSSCQIKKMKLRFPSHIFLLQLIDFDAAARHALGKHHVGLP